MATVRFDRKYSDIGNGFMVSVQTELRTKPHGGFLNAVLFPEWLTEKARELCAEVSKIPGICGEVLVGAYSFETGIDWSFDSAPVIDQVDKAIQSVLGEGIEAIKVY